MTLPGETEAGSANSPFKRHRGEASHDEYRNSATSGIIYAAAEVFGPYIYVHQDHLRCARDH